MNTIKYGYNIQRNGDLYTVTEHVIYPLISRLEQLCKALGFLILGCVTGNTKGLAISQRAWKAFQTKEVQSKATLDKTLRVVEGRFVHTEKAINWAKGRIEAPALPNQDESVKVEPDKRAPQILNAIPKDVLAHMMSLNEFQDRNSCLQTSKRLNAGCRQATKNELLICAGELEKILAMNFVSDEEATLIRSILNNEKIKTPSLEIGQRRELIAKAVFDIINYHFVANLALKDNQELLLFLTKGYVEEIFSQGYVSRLLKDNEDFMLKVIQENSADAFRWASRNIRNTNSKVALEAIKRNPACFAHCRRGLKYNLPFVLSVIPYLVVPFTKFRDIPVALRRDRNVLLAGVKLEPLVLQYAIGDAIKDDPEIVTTAAEKNFHCMKHAGKIIKENKKFILNLLKEVGDIRLLDYVSPEVLKDKDFMLQAFQLDENFYKRGSALLLGNRYYITEAVKKNPRILAMASAELRNEQLFMMEMVGMDGLFLEYASDDLKTNFMLIMVAYSQNRDAIKFVPEPYQTILKNFIEGKFKL